MSKATIMLAAKFDTNKLEYPVEVTTKLDGSAADFYKIQDGTWAVRTRQNKPVESVQHLLDILNEELHWADTGTHIIGELTVTGENSFKTANGIIRRKVNDPRIVLNIYDCYVEGEDEDYFTRLEDMAEILDSLSKSYIELDGVKYQAIKRVPVNGIADSIVELNEYISSVDSMMKASPLAEGYVIRSLVGPTSHYKIAKRPNGFMKFKPQPTVDLKVISFEEATANKCMTFLDEEFVEGEGLRAVGRINVEFQGEVVGVGPGCLSHKERRTLWEGYVNNFKRHGVDLAETGLIIEVGFMLDPDVKLREGRFKRWRPDKVEPSEVA